jgi:peptidoglycan/xylan/chitin deacetylase (PgdA/CDA1 family)
VSGGRASVTFHGVGPQVRPLDPGEEEVWLASEPFLALLDAVVETPGVHVTFDDGNASDVEIALPALRERGLRATFFVVAGRLGTPGYLANDDVRRLAEAGMGIGCHGMDHVPWRRLADARLDEELGAARTRLEAACGAPVIEAACPFGAYDRRVLTRLRAHGYRRVWTSDRGAAAAGAWLQPRTTLRAADAACARDALARAARRPGPGRRAVLTVKRWR